MEDYLTINIAERITHILEGQLVSNCPVLSGNMQSMITYKQISPKKWEITISGPSYDLAYWRATGIVLRDGKYDYALSVNEKGAFNGKSKISQHWVDKTISATLNSCGAMFNANVDNQMGE